MYLFFFLWVSSLRECQNLFHYLSATFPLSKFLSFKNNHEFSSHMSSVSYNDNKYAPLSTLHANISNLVCVIGTFKLALELSAVYAFYFEACTNPFKKLSFQHQWTVKYFTHISNLNLNRLFFKLIDRFRYFPVSHYLSASDKCFVNAPNSFYCWHCHVGFFSNC